MKTRNPHPNLIMESSNADMGEFVGYLLQTIEDLESKESSSTIQLGKEKEKLKQEWDQLRKAQAALKENEERLLKFQSFIMKLAKQIEEESPGLQPMSHPALKRNSGI